MGLTEKERAGAGGSATGQSQEGDWKVQTSQPTPSVQPRHAFKPRIRRTHERGVFEVSSRTRPNLFHKTDVVHLECSCEAGRNGIRCWHLAYALQAERVYAAVDAQHGRKTPLLQPVPVSAPASDFHQSAGYRALAECFA